MQKYNVIQKFIHDLVLKSNMIKRSLYEIEKIFYLKNNQNPEIETIFISGLPRSGTTILLNFLYLNDDFASLKYKNMPFITSPNLSKIFFNKNIESTERFHQDGINFNLESPEAFDQVFFNTFTDEEIKKEFINYVNLILCSEKKEKYLSKNNFLFNKIKLIKEILPNSKFLIPIRDPLQQSYSLYKQHIHFLNLQRKDDFVRRYMNYLGHTEFGLDHKYWFEPQNFKDNQSINYWMEQWQMFYKFMHQNFLDDNSCLFIKYDHLNNPNEIEKILKFINVKDFKNFNFKIQKHSIKDVNYSSDLYSKSKEVYDNIS